MKRRGGRSHRSKSSMNQMMMMKMMQQPSYNMNGMDQFGYEQQPIDPQVHNMQVIDQILRSDRKTKKKFRDMLKSMMEIRGIPMPHTDIYNGLMLGPQMGNFPPPGAAGLPPGAARVPPSAPGMPPSAPGMPPVAPGMPPVAPGMPPVAPGLPPSAAGLPPVAAGLPPVAAGLPPGAAGTQPSLYNQGANVLQSIKNGIPTNPFARTKKNPLPGAAGVPPSVQPTFNPNAKYTWTKRAMWPKSMNDQGVKMLGTAWPSSREVTVFPIAEYINKAERGTIYNPIPSWTTRLQKRIDNGEWQQFHQGFPSGTGGAGFLENWTNFLNWLRERGVTEKDVLSGLINTFKLNLSTASRIDTFAHMFHKNDNTAQSTEPTIREWLRYKVMNGPRPKAKIYDKVTLKAQNWWNKRNPEESSSL
jgi:hypothetical protein